MIKKPLKEYLQEADTAATRVSEISRNLGLGAIAVIWIFKNPEKAPSLLPTKLLSWALLLAVCSLSMDLFQYIFNSTTIYRFYEKKEALYDKGKLSDEDISDVQAPDYIRIGTNFFWWSKIVLIIACYALISFFLIRKL